MKLLRRLPVLLAALAVLVMSTAYAAHRHKQELASEGQTTEHCELCLQVGRGAAPVAAAPALLVAALGWAAWVLVVTGRSLVLSSPASRAQRARAPPR